MTIKINRIWMSTASVINLNKFDHCTYYMYYISLTTSLKFMHALVF